MKSLLKHVGVFHLACIDMFTDRGRGMVYFGLSFVNALVYFQIWKSAGVKMIGGIDLQSYYFLLMAIGSFVFVHVETPIAYLDIAEGNLSSLLTKPYSYGLYRLFSELPWRLFQGMVGALLIIFLELVFHVSIHVVTGWIEILIMILSILFGFFIMYLYKTILGLAAFWMTEILGLTQTSDVVLLLLGGYVIPIVAFPSWAQTIAWMTPFPYVAYVPVLLAGGSVTITQSFQYLFGQICWIGILSVVVYFVWNAGVKLYVGMGE